jgi:hypothetical protein
MRAVRANRSAIVAALIVVMGVSACGNRGEEPNLRVLRSPGSGPDEFAIVPPRPLEMPEDLTALPEPTPGGRNRTDQTPIADAVVALGGRPGAGGGDAALVAGTGRFGVSPTVREDLAAEDREARRRTRPRLLERLFGTDVYNRAYAGEQVRSFDELERWRAAGRRTPAAPPDPRFFPDARR